MDALDKYVSQEGLQYFAGSVNGLVISESSEITDPVFAQENNVIVLWSSGSKVKCNAPANVGYDTKLLYVGMNVYIDAPDTITLSGSDLIETVEYEENYTLVRTRSSSSDPWPPYFDTLNGDSIWNEPGKRANVQTHWAKVEQSYTTTIGCTSGNHVYGDPTVGTLSPSDQIATAQGGNLMTMKPVFGYNS